MICCSWDERCEQVIIMLDDDDAYDHEYNSTTAADEWSAEEWIYNS